jgi:RNA polymerase sigma-70 factor (ECF subfamily)
MASLTPFQASRSRLISIAYRMLGSASDAEDAVQEVWMRWQDADQASIQNPEAWLSAVVSRLCLDKLKALRVRRETYTGPWLPEPVVSERPIDRESISLAFMVVLERLSPSERAVYLLHRVFDYKHREIADALQMSEAAVRQAFHRAQEHIAENRPRFAPSTEDHQRLLTAFASALVAGDLSALTQLLAKDAALYVDGGGKVQAAPVPLHGGDNIARFFAGLVNAFSSPHQSYEVRPINGWPALVGRLARKVNAIVTIETDGTRISAIRNVLNPDKLSLFEVN